MIKISLVIPLKNEENSFVGLYESIRRQTLPPDEVVLVDGGSTDDTIAVVEKAICGQTNFKFIKTPQASPGKGRNIGTDNARNEWIVYTDAGIRLTDEWLENLAEKVMTTPEVSIVYGNYAPRIGSFFEKIAALTYVGAQKPNVIRGKSIVSYLMKKDVWSKVGGFPDLRAAEDLIFMEEAEKLGFTFAFAPDALLYWELQPNISSTFIKFVLYSKHNIWAGRAWSWHYGVLKLYLILIPVLFVTFFYPWAAVFFALWLFARTLKRVLPHRFQFGLLNVLNPLVLLSVSFMILVLDAATFIGWAQAVLQKKS